ncbi:MULTISPECIES: TSUP family transporter [Cupriavidus]|uniref:Probable membrane transporter protein n=2 Tax=Cupriavidus TaxID=106589 RepID=A0A375HVX8_9BURK|nr:MULTISPECIES: TSUP family transporter [Cupriavidus]SOZ09608.1 putative membrane protein [Cupriavidus taiwanensis]SOZ11729.1 putative membrane protein [Cupriavidus taiwanensis]SOZ39782.1 putative membrane protein [Cupriavidus neocaledonicus]SOZ43084.1 putative membrane protein [Cupriavidus taiwanensis]SPC22330.1 putative membrane protein [Cupriavidus taiwanensis]
MLSGDTEARAHLLFVLFVAISVYASNVTGFALALVLLGLVALTDIVPLPDAVNAVTVIIVLNAALFLYKRRPLRIQPEIKPAVVCSLGGSLVGMALLTFLATHAFQTLRALLGICVVGCAMLLWKAARPYAVASGPRTFAFVGALSGVLGGMFATASPPLVYAVYRQPWSVEVIQESLIFSFGVGAVLRLSVMGLSGQVNLFALQLAAEALPVAMLVTILAANRQPPVSKERLRQIVCILLVCVGIGILL